MYSVDNLESVFTNPSSMIFTRISYKRTNNLTECSERIKQIIHSKYSWSPSLWTCNPNTDFELPIQACNSRRCFAGSGHLWRCPMKLLISANVELLFQKYVVGMFLLMFLTDLWNKTNPCLSGNPHCSVGPVAILHCGHHL